MTPVKSFSFISGEGKALVLGLSDFCVNNTRALPCTHTVATLYLNIPLWGYTMILCSVLYRKCVLFQGSKEYRNSWNSCSQCLSGSPASWSQSASESAGLIHFERQPSGPSYRDDGLVYMSLCVCVCERGGKYERKWVGVVLCLPSHMPTCVYAYMYSHTCSLKWANVKIRASTSC